VIKDLLEILRESISDLYNKFVMRDILSIVLPGFISLICFFTILNAKTAKDIIANIPTIVLFNSNWKILFLIVISYPIGWALFYLGICLGIIKLCKRNGPVWWKICIQSKANWREDLGKYWYDELLFGKKLYELEKDNVIKAEKEILYRERIVVIRQMVGTFFMSLVTNILLIGGFLIISVIPNTLKPKILVDNLTRGQFIGVLYVLIVCAGLYLAHHRIIEQQEIWQNSRIAWPNVAEKQQRARFLCKIYRIFARYIFSCSKKSSLNK